MTVRQLTYRHLAKGLVLFMLMYAATSQANTTDSKVNDQLMQQEALRQKQLQQQQQSEPNVRLNPAVEVPLHFPEQESPCFPIQQIELTGADAGLFAWALQETLAADPTIRGHCLGTEGINVLMRMVQNRIVQRGFVTTTVLVAPQDLKSGTLQLQVLAGRIHQIRFAEGTDPRAHLLTALPMGQGDVLNLRDIEQALENFKRVPTADADIQIVPAEQPGESDLLIQWKQAFPFRLSFSADDSGSRATGKYQGSMTLSWDHAFTLNDLFYVTTGRELGGTQTQPSGNRSYTVHYSLPLGYWQLGITTNQYRYHQQVLGTHQQYQYAGLSRGTDLKLSRVIARDATGKTTLFLRGYQKSSRNFVDDTEVQVQYRRTAGWELGLQHREFIGSATLDGSVSYRRSTGAFSSRPAPEEAFGEGSSRPAVVQASLSLEQPFKLGDQAFRLGSELRGQWNRTLLAPQDRFSIGGRYTVRGFDGEYSLTGDRGILWRNELGWQTGAGLPELYLALDLGRVDGPSSANGLGHTLIGSVVGIRGAWRGLQYEWFVGKPVRKPAGFITRRHVTGFYLSWSL